MTALPRQIGRPLGSFKKAVTSGVSPSGKGYWRYWTNVDGVLTRGPSRRTPQLAELDRDAALAGNPPAVKPRRGWTGLTKAQRREMGTCLQCDAQPAPQRRLCERHLTEDRDRSRARDKDRPKRRFTADVIDARLDQIGRCACGLLLPCYGGHTIDDYAGARTGDE